MKINSENIIDWTHLRFIALGSLVNKLPDLLEKDFNDDATLLLSLKNQYNPTFKNDVYSRGYKTFSDLENLERIEPETYKEFNRQIGIELNIAKLEGDLFEAKLNFERIAMSSIYLMVLAHFEDCLRRTCDVVKEELKCSLKWDDLRGSTLDSFKNYINKVLNIHFDFNISNEWKLLREYQIIRNFIIHNGGIIDDSEQSKKVMLIIEQNEYKLFDLFGQINLSRNYIIEVIRNADNFFVNLFNALEEEGI